MTLFVNLKDIVGLALLAIFALIVLGYIGWAELSKRFARKRAGTLKEGDG